MEVFISWSGKRSKSFAKNLKRFLKDVLHPIKPWFSSEDIYKGNRWSVEIGKKLDQCSYGLICLTPENQERPWIQFEAGAISKSIKDGKVFPILTCGLGNADLKGPLTQFQSTIYNKVDFFKLITVLNEGMDEYKKEPEHLKSSFEHFWDKFADKVNRELSEIQFSNTSDIFPQILEALQSSSDLPSPEIGMNTYFKSGFESHVIYNTALRLAKNRLLIFGRKNRKLFDKEYDSFFQKLNHRLKGNFEFKCLFLNPESEENVLKRAHEDEDFLQQLDNSIESAISVSQKNNIDVDEVFRFYDFQRAFSYIIVDDAILFRPIEYDDNGFTKRLTKASFTLTSTTTSDGKILLENFEKYWRRGKKMKTAHNKG